MASCPNKNDPKYKELVQIFGEYKAMFLWNANNGNPITETPEGKYSPLFRDLMILTGDRKLAMVEKSKTYDPAFIEKFGDWINNPDQASLVMRNGEPQPVYPINPQGGFFRYRITPDPDDTVQNLTYLKITQDREVVDLKEAADTGASQGYMNTKAGRIYFANTQDQEISNVANQYTEQTEKIITNQLRNEKFADNKLKRLPIGIPVDGVVDVVKANAYIQERYGKGELFVKTPEGVYVNEDVLNRIHRVETTDIRGVPNNKSSKFRDKKLKEKMLKLLGDMGVEVRSLESYRNWYRSEYGKEPSGEMIALLTQKLVLLSDTEARIDSLPKAAAYFVVESLWHTPEMVTIRGSYLPETDLYKENFEHYRLKYDGDVLKAQKEVIADLLSRAMIHTHQSDSFVNRGVLGKITRAFKFIFGKLRAFLNRKGITKQTIPNDVRETLGYLAESFMTGELQIDTDIVTVPLQARGRLISPDMKGLGKIIRQAKSALAARKSELLREKIGLYNKQLKNRYQDLRQKYGPDIDTLTRETIPMLHEQIRLAESSDESRIYEVQLEELNEFLVLTDQFEEDKLALRQMKGIDRRVEELNKALQEKEYELGLYVFLFGAEEGKARTNGALQDARDALEIVDSVLNGTRELNNNMLANLYNTRNYYYPVIKDLETAIEFYEWNLTEISPQARLEMRQKISEVGNALRRLDSFLENHNKEIIKFHLERLNTTADGRRINPNLDYEAIAEEISTDDTFASLIAGAAQSSRSDTVGLITKHVKDVYNEVYRDTDTRMNQFVSKISPLIQTLRANSTIRTLLKKHKAASVLDLLVDKTDGKANGYMVSPYDMAGFDQAKAEAEERILVRIEEELEKSGIPFRFPRGDDPQSRQDRNSILFGEDLFTVAISEKNQADMGKLRERIVKMHRRMWGEWYLKNTVPVENWQQILKEKEQTLNDIQFQEWKRFNTITWVDNRAKIRLYPKGSLVRPSTGEAKTIVMGQDAFVTHTNDYTNQLYKELEAVPEAKELINELLKIRQEALERLPVDMSYSTDLRYRLPQISQTTVDILHKRKGWFRKMGELLQDKLGDIFVPRVDDTHVHNPGGWLTQEEDSTHRPPVRFIRWLEDPDRVSRDLIRTNMAFWEMARTYDGHNQNASMYKIAIEMTKRRRFTRGVVGKARTQLANLIGINMEAEMNGDKSNTFKMLNGFLDTMVRQNVLKPQLVNIPRTNYTIDVTKMINKLRNYFSKLNLQMNAPSFTTGYVMGQSTKMIEKYMNKLGVADSVGDSLSEGLKITMINTPFLTASYQKLLQDNKLQNWLRHFTVLNQPEDVLRNADKKRWVRVMTDFFDYTGWKQQDYLLKVPTAVAMADNLRFYKGQWLTKNQFMAENSLIATEESDVIKELRKMDPKEKLKIWKDLKKNDQTFWDAFDVVPGQGLVVKKGYTVSEDDLNFFKNRVDVVNSRIDQLPLSIDRSGIIYRNFALQMVSLHKGWLFQFLERRWKAPHFNYQTLRKEEGYYWGAYNYIKDYLMGGFGKNLTNSMKFALTFGRKGESFYRNQDILTKEAIIRVLMDQMVIYLAYGAMYLFNTLAADDDDESWVSEFLAYVSTRFLLEASAQAPNPIYNQELFELVQRPVPTTANPVDIPTYLLTFIPWLSLHDEQDVISRGPYKGKSKEFKNFIRALPYVRGLYETSPISPVAPEALEGKNRFLKNQVVQPPNLVSRLVEDDVP